MTDASATQNPEISEHQGIDLANIENVFKKPLAKISFGDIQSVKADILELVEHVRDSGLLDDVAQARASMADQDEKANAGMDAEDLLPSVY